MKISKHYNPNSCNIPPSVIVIIAGNYIFLDYMRVGIPLQIIIELTVNIGTAVILSILAEVPLRK